MPKRSPEGRIVAIVEDDPIMGESLVQRLVLDGITTVWWRTGAEALDALARTADLDALVCDMRLPDMSGEDVFRALSLAGRDLPVLFMTAYGDIDHAVHLMRQGAADYVTKPFEMADFLCRLGALVPPTPERMPSPLGASSAMGAIERYLQRIAGQAGPLLITGETGVGKDICARRLHELSRPNKPFVAVNCAAIPAELLESELFGHERGAFTGAATRHLGYAERARDGILFLDEIAEMPKPLQAKLLRLVEGRAFHRLGGETAIPFRARIVAATNRDIRAAVAQGDFRQDLLYRLDVFSVEIPPLRERPEDIQWLLELELAALLGRGPGAVRGFSALAVEAARSHPWPGNGRELRNRLERAVALADGEVLQSSDLFPNGPAAAQPSAAPLTAIRDAAERRAIESALVDASGHPATAARLLGISRTTLWEKMKRLGVSA